MAACPRCAYSGKEGHIKVRFGVPGQGSRTPYKDIVWAGPARYIECPVCLGLGSFETNPAFKRPPLTHHFTVLHSEMKLEDVLDLLPIKEETDG